MSRQLTNNVPHQTDLAARVAQLEKRCDGLFQMAQALQAARGSDLLKANAKADPFAGYGFGQQRYDLNGLQQEGGRDE